MSPLSSISIKTQLNYQISIKNYSLYPFYPLKNFEIVKKFLFQKNSFLNLIANQLFIPGAKFKTGQK